MRKSRNIFYPIATLYKSLSGIFLKNKQEELLQNKCLELRDYINQTKKMKKEVKVDERKVKGLFTDLGKIKIESYQMEMHKKLDDLLNEIEWKR